MENLRKNLIWFTLGLTVLIISCKDSKDYNNSIPLNSLDMYVNNLFWEPTIINEDPCYAELNCNQWYVNQTPIYTIEAKRSHTVESEYLRLQVRNVNDIGFYYINDSKGDFTSYAMLVKKESDTEIIYTNSDARNNSIVEIREMFNNYKTKEKIAIKGSFRGVLYNIQNANDSIVIEDCKFTFGRINWGGMNAACHCAD